MQSFREAFGIFASCLWWRTNLAVIIISAASSAYMMRWLISIYAMAFPVDTWAAEFAYQVLNMSGPQFWSTCFIAAFGGVASLFHEIKQGRMVINFINAVGHMFSAQFAGLLTYFIGMELGFSWPWAMVACGLAGWGGNAAITRLNDFVMRKLGIDPPAPPKGGA